MPSEEECNAVGASHVSGVALTELPPLTELQKSGRRSIVRG